MNMYFSYRVSIAILVFLNLPLLVTYGLMYKARKDGDTEAAYNWNGKFIAFYSIRCTAFLIGGIVAIAISQYSDTSMDFFCDRYGGYDFESIADMEAAEKKEFGLELESCRHFVRNILIILYIPLLIF